MVRYPAAIGFYPADRDNLIKEIEKCFLHPYGPGQLPTDKKQNQKIVFGGISPHAGYIFSGPVAAHLYYALASQKPPKTVILLGPSHMYPVDGAAIARGEDWATPLGVIKIDDMLVLEILNSIDNIMENNYAHKNEHSLEVQLPFLQYIYGNEFKIVPIAIGSHNLDALTEIGSGIADVIKEKLDDVIVITSSDFTHYGAGYGYAPAGSGPVSKILDWMYTHDQEAIEYIIKLDEKGFFNYVKEHDMTICGFAPITSLIVIAKQLGISNATLLKYATSWDTNEAYRSSSQIVGYAAISFSLK
ncbi:MAG: AmmeMemoRadiSam system protein B [Candidatus Asgardarchaeia archaeon]